MQVKAIKLGDKLAVSVLAAPYGSTNDRDSDGEFFTPRTKFHLDRYTPTPIYYHGYTKSKQQAPEPVFLGQTVKSETDSQGVWLTVELDQSVPEAMEVWNAAESRKAAASSGSIAHLVRKTSDGEILQWPMAEISLWEQTADRPQANKRAIALPALKAAGINVPDELVEHCESEDQAEENVDQRSGAGGDSSSYISDTSVKESTKMSDEKTPDVQALVNDAVKSALAQAEKERQAAADAEKAKQEAVDAAVKAATEAAAEAAVKTQEEHEAALKAAQEEAAKANRLPMGGQAPYQTKFAYTKRFENMDPISAAFAVDVMARKGQPMGDDAVKAAAILVGDMKPADRSNAHEEAYLHPQEAMKMAGVPVKADEINQTDLASYGQEWVSNVWSGELWRRILFETPVVNRIPRVDIPQGASSVTIPIEADGVSFYRTPQAADYSANPGRPSPTVQVEKHGTLNNTIDSKKISGAVTYSAEITEDSIVQWAPEMQRMLQQRGMEVLEHLVIDGDTALTTSNINSTGAAPTARDVYTALDGFRKLALVTNTANALDATGTLTVEQYLETIKLMGKAGRNARNKGAVSFITDMNTNWATLALNEVKNRDYMPVGANPTVSGGNLTNLWGYEVIPSGFMHETDEGLMTAVNGTIDIATPGTRGAILAVRWDQWRLGYGRLWQLEVEKDIYSDSHVIVMHSRVGMIPRDNEASAISYNVLV